jgi:hypothetical protein
MNMLRAPSRGVLRAWGFVLATASVVLPALPLGPLFAQPPMPMAVLWAAYGWAAEDKRGVSTPVTLAIFGLLHDQLAGGPYGLFTFLYLAVYLIGRVLAVIMSAPNLVSLWGGFIATMLVSIAVMAVIARVFAPIAIIPYAETAMITAVLFPLVRPLYMGGAPSTRIQPGARK